MSWDKRIWILCVFLCLLPGACVNLKQPRQEVQFYTLEYDPPRLQELAPLPVVIRVEGFTAAPTYNTNRMIYRDGSFKRDAYVYHKWRTNPGDLITHLLGRDLKQAGLFRGTLSHRSSAPASYVLEGSVDEFFEWDEADAWEAVLSISVTLLRENAPDAGEAILFQRTYHGKEPLRQKHPSALAEAMSIVMSKISGEVTKDIYDHLKDGR